MRFIERCIKCGIEIKDGFHIPYDFGGKKHIYKSDFYLPNLGIVVEIKDEHVWHKNQVKSGKWEAKEKSAKQFCEKNNLVYKMLFPNDIDDFFKPYERDSQNCSENCRSQDKEPDDNK